MTRVLLISLAGALGTASRYFVGVFAGRALGTAFPYGTLIAGFTNIGVTMLGCFVAGLLGFAVARRIAGS